MVFFFLGRIISAVGPVLLPIRASVEPRQSFFSPCVKFPSFGARESKRASERASERAPSSLRIDDKILLFARIDDKSERGESSRASFYSVRIIEYNVRSETRETVSGR